MKSAGITAIIFIIILGSFHAAYADALSKQQLLDIIKSTAYSNHLDDAEKTGLLFGITFALRNEVSGKSCNLYKDSDAASKANMVDFYDVKENPYFTSATGRKDGSISLGYYAEKNVNCANQHISDYKRHAEVTLINFPPPICLSRQDVQSVFPQGDLSTGTRGSLMYVSSGNVNFFNGTRVEFYGNAQSNCYYMVRIEEDKRYGKISAFCEWIGKWLTCLRGSWCHIF